MCGDDGDALMTKMVMIADKTTEETKQPDKTLLQKNDFLVTGLII